MSDLSSANPQGAGGQSGGWVKLDSSSISSVAFEPQTNTLKVHFLDGDTWQYNNVSKKQYKDLLYTNSAGNYLRKEIIPNHEAKKINDRPPDQSGANA